MIIIVDHCSQGSTSKGSVGHCILLRRDYSVSYNFISLIKIIIKIVQVIFIVALFNNVRDRQVNSLAIFQMDNLCSLQLLLQLEGCLSTFDMDGLNLLMNGVITCLFVGS